MTDHEYQALDRRRDFLMNEIAQIDATSISIVSVSANLVELIRIATRSYASLDRAAFELRVTEALDDAIAPAKSAMAKQIAIIDDRMGAYEQAELMADYRRSVA